MMLFGVYLQELKHICREYIVVDRVSATSGSLNTHVAFVSINLFSFLIRF